MGAVVTFVLLIVLTAFVKRGTRRLFRGRETPPAVEPEPAAEAAPTGSKPKPTNRSRSKAPRRPR